MATCSLLLNTNVVFWFFKNLSEISLTWLESFRFYSSSLLIRLSKCNLYSFIMVWELAIFLTTWSAFFIASYFHMNPDEFNCVTFPYDFFVNLKDLSYNFVILFWIFYNRCCIIGVNEYYDFLIEFYEQL